MASSTAVPDTSTRTDRERMLACLRGEAVDRLPVWLKMANPTWRSAQPEEVARMDSVELLRACGCDLVLGCGVQFERSAPHVERQDVRGDTVIEHRLRTPDGELAGESAVDPATGSTHPTRFMLQTPEDLRRLRWAYLDTEYTVTPEAAERARHRQQELTDLGAITFCGLEPSPFMDVLQHLAGPENTYYLLADAPEEMSQLLEVMHRDRLRQLRARLPHEAADTIWLTENTSTSLMSPAVFEHYCMDYLAAYANLCLEHERIPVHHMCGTLGALLELVDRLPAWANEAFTTRPLGDVSLAEGRRRMPAKTLIGGTNATLWLEPASTIVETVRRDLADCPDRRRIFLTSAGVLPPPVSLAKAREVVEEFKRL